MEQTKRQKIGVARWMAGTSGLLGVVFVVQAGLAQQSANPCDSCDTDCSGEAVWYRSSGEQECGRRRGIERTAEARRGRHQSARPLDDLKHAIQMERWPAISSSRTP
jgi:hypothetical protein